MTRIFKGGSGLPIVIYDLVAEVVVAEATDYAFHLLVHEGLSGTTVDTATNHIVRFANFILSEPRRRVKPWSLREALHGLTNSRVKAFRDRELDLVMVNFRSRQKKRKAKATVNARLAAVYHWLWWLRGEGFLSENVVGPKDCAVEMGALSNQEISRRKSRRTNYSRERRKVASRERLSMPLLYTDAEGRGRLKTGFVPSRDIVDKVVECLMKRESSQYRNLRDALIVDLAVEVGLRVGSIASLKVSDFDERLIENTLEPTVSITPSVQKFSYENSFDVPVWLALRVCSLIRIRDEHARARGAMATLSHQHIFVSDRTFGPLKSRSISQLLSEILRSLGAPKGTSIHAFRGLFCTEEVEREIAHRVEKNMDTSAASVSAVVAMRMGHADPNSYFAYVSRAMSRRAAQDRAKRLISTQK